MTNSQSKPILVTGASSGIGAHLTRYLVERGHHIFATARKEPDLAKLKQVENVTPIHLDVRDPDLIRAAHNLIASKGQGLFGLVNNAGIGGLGMFNTWTDEEIYEIFDVNVFGPLRMTNTFIRMLIQSKGRVVNIGSQGGMITSKYFGPYSMTKYALEAFTDALQQELEPYGAHVSIVQPGGIQTEVGANAMPGTLARFQRAEAPFDEEANQLLSTLDQPPEHHEDGAESETNRKPSSPEIVSIAVYDALPGGHPMGGRSSHQWFARKVIRQE